MVDQTTMFWMTMEPWLTIGGMTIIVVFINYSLFHLYRFLAPQEQYSSKIRKIILIFGLAVFSLTSISTWLFSINLLTSQ